VSYRTRWTRQLRGVALAAAAAVTAAGCTSGSAGTAAGGTAGTAPAVTLAQASRAFDSYVAASEAAAHTGDEALALSDVTGVARSEVSADFKAVRTPGQPAPYPVYSYAKPALYLPAPSGYPRWFAASVTGTLRPPVPDTKSTAPKPMVLLFTQASARAPWLLASRSYLAHGVPDLAVNKDGQTPVVAMSQTPGLVVRPDVVGPMLAAVVDDGPSSPAARDVSLDPYTMSFYQVGRGGNGFTTPRGDVRQWTLDGSDYAQFALRTADGGALVFFAMYLNTTIAVPAELNSGEPVNPGPPITVPSDMSWMLPAGTVPRVKLERQDLYSFVAVDPPSGHGKIQLIGDDGFLNYASAS
jgi:hypothetical protein